MELGFLLEAMENHFNQHKHLHHTLLWLRYRCMCSSHSEDHKHHGLPGASTGQGKAPDSS